MHFLTRALSLSLLLFEAPALLHRIRQLGEAIPELEPPGVKLEPLRDRRVGLLAFSEFVSSQYTELFGSGLTVFDLEQDVRAFNQVLPRLRIIDIDAFDPTAFL